MLNTKARTLIIWALIFPLISLSSNRASVQKGSVIGRVVKIANGVARTEVLLYFGPGGSDEVLPSYVTEPNGDFFIETYARGQARSISTRLYVMSFCRPDDVMLTAPPFWPALRKQRRFAGKDIIIGQGDLTRIGDVDVQLNYGHVNLKILDQRQQPLLTRLSDWSPVWIRVRDQSGVRVHESGLSPAQIEKSVHLRASEIDLALPTGIWTLEVALDGVPTETGTRRAVKWLRIPGKLNVDSCDKPVDASLSVPRNARSHRLKS